MKIEAKGTLSTGGPPRGIRKGTPIAEHRAFGAPKTVICGRPHGISMMSGPKYTVDGEPWVLVKPTAEVVYGVTTVTHFNR